MKVKKSFASCIRMMSLSKKARLSLMNQSKPVNLFQFQYENIQYVIFQYKGSSFLLETQLNTKAIIKQM